MFIPILTNKIFVSYLGGSGGDLITGLCNQINLNQFLDKHALKSVPWSIKHLENIKDQVELKKILSEINYRYISTHDYDFLINNKLNTISLETNDHDLRLHIIYRQMFLQKLNIMINSGHWSELVRSYCLRQQYYKAAVIWLDYSQRHWISQMDHRTNSNNSCVKKISIDRLFQSDFIDSLINQGLDLNIAAKKIYTDWLLRNSLSTWTREHTIEKMQNKLKKMDWNQSHGIVVYNG